MAAVSRAMVCGLGASGVAAARLLRAEGAAVCAVDERDMPESRRSAAALEALGCAVALGASAPPAGDFDVAVASPGLPADGAFLAEIRRRGIPLLSEMELGWSRFRGGLLGGSTGNRRRIGYRHGLSRRRQGTGRRTGRKTGHCRFSLRP